MSRSKDETLREITTAYLQQINPANPPTPDNIQADILDAIQLQFNLENAARAKGSTWRIPDRLVPAQIADILLALYPIVNIAYGGLNADPEYDVLTLYQSDGVDKGTYSPNVRAIRNLIRRYCYTLPDKEIKDTIAALKDKAPRVARCADRNLIAVNNGIFDYDTKTLYDFTPDFVFTSKSHVDYNPNAVNPVIHNPDDGTDWDVESWMDDLFDDQEITDLIWQIIGAIIRPNVPWNKSAWFYSNTGNNGKGTLCELMRQITGNETCASIPLTDFGKDFLLEPLLKASAIIVDENDVGTFIDKAGNLKAIITNDVIQVNRKFKEPVSFQFKGFMVQCLNEMPKIKDKSDSFYRRQLFIPFDKCFTGQERKYIKADYLHRKAVLEYVLYRVLHMDYYALSEPEACKLALAEYKQFNDPIRQFVEEILPECKWDLLPYAFLYDLYKAWFKLASPSGTQVGRNTFIVDLNNAILGSSEWYPVPNGNAVRPGSMMNAAEPLIFDYHLDKWMNPAYRGSDVEKLCHPDLKANYKGLLRHTAAGQNDD